MLLIPAIDLRDGRCVRLRQGDFAAETCCASDPGELLERYCRLGASWVHVVDLDGAKDGTRANHALIAQLAACEDVRLQVGGGIRSDTTLGELFDADVARVVVGSAAVQRPARVAAWLRRFGAERICLAFDVRIDERGEPQVQTHGWQRASGLTLWEALRRYAAGSVRHVLCTDIARDGTLAGPNLALYRLALARFPGCAWQASGGVRAAHDLAALARTGVAAAVSGRALLEERMSSEELRPFLPNASFPASTYATAGS